MISKSVVRRCIPVLAHVNFIRAGSVSDGCPALSLTLPARNPLLLERLRQPRDIARAGGHRDAGAVECRADLLVAAAQVLREECLRNRVEGEAVRRAGGNR